MACVVVCVCKSCLSRLIVAEDVPDPVAEVISQHQQRSVPTAQTSPSHHYQHQQQQQHPQQHHYQYQQQPQQQLHHQQQGNHHLHQSANHRQPDFKTGASSIRAPNTESSQNSRPMASSTVVYCSQPNALGKTCFSRILLYHCLVGFGFCFTSA